MLYRPTDSFGKVLYCIGRRTPSGKFYIVSADGLLGEGSASSIYIPFGKHCTELGESNLVMFGICEYNKVLLFVFHGLYAFVSFPVNIWRRCPMDLVRRQADGN